MADLFHGQLRAGDLVRNTVRHHPTTRITGTVVSTKGVLVEVRNETVEHGEPGCGFHRVGAVTRSAAFLWEKV